MNLFGSFFKWEGEGFEGIRGSKIPLQTLLLIPPNWGQLKGKGSGSTYFKKT